MSSDIEKIYRLEDDVYLSFDKASQCSRILKLNDDNMYYQANLVAAEIVQLIKGKQSVNEIVKEVAQKYDAKHFDEIMTGAKNLFATLIEKKLIKEVK